MNLPDFNKEFFQHNRIIQFFVLIVTFTCLSISLAVIDHESKQKYLSYRTSPDVLGIASYPLGSTPLSIASTGVDESFIGVVSDTANGFIAVWYTGDAAPYTVYAQRYNNSGVAQWGANVNVGTLQDGDAKKVVQDGSGGVIVMAGNKLHRVTSTGTLPWGAGTTIFGA
jgi:hypothetical protein